VLTEAEPPAVPVSLIYPGQGRLPMKTRAFIDFAAGRLRERLAEIVAPPSMGQNLAEPS
jgi:hypothetical protein